MTAKQTPNWQTILEASFAPLARINEDDTFVGFGGSGALIDFGDRRFLCSALHVFVNHRISLQINWVAQQNQTRTLPLRPELCFETPTTRARLLDFAICDITHNLEIPMVQDLDPNGSGKILMERPRTIFGKKCLSKPDKITEYGFAGITLPKREVHPEITIGSGIVRTVTGLKYLGDSEGFHNFGLSIDHPGHIYFEGCSGAPIIDIDGKIVAFVCGGNMENSTIRGFPAIMAKRFLTKYTEEES
ncbi:MAG: hypothetical protein SFY67_10345 [Candidatus Melainabacteria bacterium]|nr:hypothetical protein [Candidatus Melainabacteria bacterium]